MGSLRFLTLTFVLLAVLTVSQGKKKEATGTVPCPEDGSVGCIECACDGSGFNSCKPLKDCPAPAKMADVKPKSGESCPYGKSFKAECTLCACSGAGDHCALCFALPVRRPGQAEDVNKKLPWLQDNRFFNYEVNGWSKSEEF